MNGCIIISLFLRKNKNMKQIYLAGGCFWGTQHLIKQITGVVSTSAGYANGHTEDPIYEEVYTDETGYAETVLVEYDPDKVSLEYILTLYFRSIDPTLLNRQGGDMGTRYRTGIYYVDDVDFPTIQEVYNRVAQQHTAPLVVEVEPLHNFYPAEDYHQDYLEKRPGGYCHIPRALIEEVRRANNR